MLPSRRPGSISGVTGDPAGSSSAPSWHYRPLFPKHWQRRSLLALAHWVNGLAFRNIQFSPAAAGGKPVIKIAEIKGGISAQTKFTTQTFDDAVRVRAGDLLFSWSGQPETSIDAYRWRGPEGWLNQHVFRVTPVDVDTAFFHYLLRYLNPHFVAIAKNKQTTGLGHVTRRDLETMRVAVPSPSEQRAIGHVLGSLDDKIDLNRRMNETLEAMVRALFKSWFVDFEPVRAKMEGRDTGLPAHIADLFPDRLTGSALGMSPAGWEVVELGDCVEIVRGLSYKGSGLSADGLPMHNLNSIHEGGGYKEAGIKFYRGDYKARHVIRPGELIVANTEQGHDRRLIGYSAVVPSYFGQAGLFSHHLYRLELKGGRRLSPDYLCELLNAPGMQRMVSGYATGTTVNMLPSDALQRPPVSIPPAPLMELFRKLAADLRTRREALVRECRALAAARDELLPRLVSGSLRATGQISQRGVSGTGSERPLSDAPRANTYR